MPESRSLANPPSEKPQHYNYLKGFRTEQCQAFVQHKCGQHRPFTCFNWHFQNQRRRRPKIKRDGSFNYSADVYCSSYDESTGTCSNGDDCASLHRNAGDTERRFHLRYYKTTVCSHETDSRGHCEKNGPHCCFAHGHDDLRQPVYCVRESDGGGESLAGMSPRGASASGKEKDRGFPLDDPRWQDHKFVLFYYKTELCRKPPKSCRQGYACPYYHNGKDKRRSPKKHKYRSTPCPNVKHGDEWCEPNDCEKGDHCCYCHTRTEQQFHPEIYKSTKCYDMLQTKSCPRGPFCAFAHREEEMRGFKDVLDSEEPLAAHTPSKTSALSPRKEQLLQSKPRAISRPVAAPGAENSYRGLVHSAPTQAKSLLIQRDRDEGNVGSLGSYEGHSASNIFSGMGDDDVQQQILMRRQIIAIDNDTSLGEEEKARQKQNVRLYHSSFHASPDTVTMSQGSSLGTPVAMGGASGGSLTGLHPSHFFPSGSIPDLFDPSNVQNLSLDDDDVMNPIDDLDMREIEKEIGKASSGRGGSVGSSHPSSLSSSLSSSFPGPFGSAFLGGPLTPPFGLGSGLAVGSAFPSHVQANPYSGRLSSVTGDHLFSGSPHHAHSYPSPSPKQSPKQSPGNPLAGNPERTPTDRSPSSPAVNPDAEIRRLREELSQSQSKLVAWEDSWTQAKQACEAWKKDASEKGEKLKKLEDENKGLALASGGSSQHLQRIDKSAHLDKLPLSDLRCMEEEVRGDLRKIEKAVYHREALKCIKCHEWQRSVVMYPCKHCVLCETCAEGRKECAYCNARIQRQATIFIPHNPVEN